MLKGHVPLLIDAKNDDKRWKQVFYWLCDCVSETQEIAFELIKSVGIAFKSLNNRICSEVNSPISAKGVNS